MTKMILLVVLVLAGAIGGFMYFQNMNNEKAMVAEDMTPTPTPVVSPEATDIMTPSEVKEFTMTSYYEMKDGKPSAHFSLSEITVKKGDTVRIKVTNTKGMHDFSLDEFGIRKATPLNDEVTIEFVADKAGSFQYYCSMPGHRQMGQFGTLNVQE